MNAGPTTAVFLSSRTVRMRPQVHLNIFGMFATSVAIQNIAIWLCRSKLLLSNIVLLLSFQGSFASSSSSSSSFSSFFLFLFFFFISLFLCGISTKNKSPQASVFHRSIIHYLFPLLISGTKNKGQLTGPVCDEPVTQASVDPKSEVSP